MKKGMIRASVFVCITLFLLISLVVAVRYMAPSDGMGAVSSAEDNTTSQWLQLTINGCDLWVDTYASEQTYDTVTLTSEFPNVVQIGSFQGYQIYMGNQEIRPNTTADIIISELSSESPLMLRFVEKGTGVERVQYLNTIPPNYVSTAILSQNVEKGFYYFNIDNYVYKMNTDGEVVFFRLAGGDYTSPGGDDFKRTEVDGKVYYSFLWGQSDSQDPILTDVGYGRMQAMILDESYQFVDNVAFTVPTESNEGFRALENHQFTILGEGHYLLSSYVGKRVDNLPESVSDSGYGARVVACVLQEVKDGKLLFEWDSTDYPQLFEYSLEGNEFDNTQRFWCDYVHFNAVAVDPKDNNLLLSMRNLDAVLKIDRISGEILWVLGGKGDQFHLVQEQHFSRQHDVRLTADGGITLFNNGNKNGSSTEGQTNIMKFYLDEDSKTVTQFQKYEIPGAFAPFMGSAQELSDGHFLICWGGRHTALPLFSEIDFNTKTVLFEYARPICNTNGERSNAYRAYKSDQ